MTRIRGYGVIAGKMGLLKGSLFLEQAGNENGARVSGRIEAEIYSKEMSPAEAAPLSDE